MTRRFEAEAETQAIRASQEQVDKQKQQLVTAQEEQQRLVQLVKGQMNLLRSMASTVSLQAPALIHYVRETCG